MTTLLWLRRDLRRQDHPALVAAHAATADDVAVLFVVDPAMWRRAGTAAKAWVAATVQATKTLYGGRLAIGYGDPQQVVPRVAQQVGATSVHVTRETTPTGARRDARVAKLLQDNGIDWIETGTPYAIGPGLVRTKAGAGYSVFTPFSRAWRDHEVPGPAPDVEPTLRSVPSDADGEAALRDAIRAAEHLTLPEAGEAAAMTRWRQFTDDLLDDYDDARNRADQDGTSGLSPYLKVGAIHPRTLLHDVSDLSARRGSSGGRGSSGDRFVAELAWREFYADVLFRHPRSSWQDLSSSLASMAYDPAGSGRERAWQQGLTGFPFVDAGMRQMLATGWMHNRVRMVTASFFTKDLHLWWPSGARYFLDHLIDADIASNNHGWQWVAGTGTDAAPYFRVFNPVTQGIKFDPNGDYVRRWIPELRHLTGAAVHEPWKHPDGYQHGYPAPIVDHAAERKVALSRYEACRTPS